MGWENALKLPLTLLVRDGHSCQSPLALMLTLILTLISTQTGKGTSSTRADRGLLLREWAASLWAQSL